MKTAHQRLYFLWRLKRFGISSDMSNFYRCTIESILTGCISVWCGNCSSSDCKALQRVVRTGELITGHKLWPYRTFTKHAAGQQHHQGLHSPCSPPVCFNAIWQMPTLNPIFKLSDCLTASSPSSSSGTLYLSHFIIATSDTVTSTSVFSLRSSQMTFI